MPITETYMDGGPWGLNLVADTPRWVLDDISVIDHLWATIIVTPQHLGASEISDANLMALARYAGVFLGMGAGRTSLFGEGLMWWLGESGDGGFIFASTDTTTAVITLDTALGTHIFTASNGLTKGTVSGSATTYQFGLEGGDTRREIFDTIIQQSDQDTAWVCTPGGVININVNTTLFPTQSTPTVLFTPEGGHDIVVDGIQAEFVVAALDGAEVREKVWVDWQDGTNNGSATLSLPTGWKDFAGAGPEVRSLIDWRPKRPRPPTERWRKLAAWQIRSETQANTLAARELNERSEVRNEIRVEVDVFDPWRFDMSPGNAVYLYDPASSIFDTTNEVYYRGEAVSPDKGIVQQWTTPILPDYGVYLRYWDGAAIAYYDLTHWVEPDSGPTQILVGHRDRLAPKVAPRTLSKLKKKRIRQQARYAAGKLRSHASDEQWSNPDSLRNWRQLGPGGNNLGPPARPHRRR